MSNGPTEQRPSEQRPTEQAWEQPTFTEREPQPVVWGPVIVPGENRLVLAPPTAQEQQLVTLRRLILPIALLVAAITGHWFPVLLLALVANGVLRRQLAMSRRARVQVVPTLR